MKKTTEVKVTKDGVLFLSEEIRERVNLQTGDFVEFFMGEKGEVILRKCKVDEGLWQVAEDDDEYDS
ncbi:AbrB/MazE/SpoVT family DNA-binding domain-containing protein [Aneurinibacillus thermoaerophilus]|nr:AbrB/MazE/SpoVT family DNA-binding domain-containing protein [Aneurinibacillus thermoaerophilus]MED0738662.1 AbrB/MazE/SpoVT family DNA-binding domain-containing protein [Aneurinibacillus thermoaerophilus]QYY42522.1 AbrB/MazE/SpoVT family DNA-binding domain-containing protein [Aneurinibacillus thermoaerophilus]